MSSSDSIAMLPSDNYPNIKYQKLPFWYKLFIIGMYIDKLFYIKHQSTIYIYSQLPLRRTPFSLSKSGRIGEVAALGGVHVNPLCLYII